MPVYQLPNLNLQYEVFSTQCILKLKQKLMSQTDLDSSNLLSVIHAMAALAVEAVDLISEQMCL